MQYLLTYQIIPNASTVNKLQWLESRFLFYQFNYQVGQKMIRRTRPVQIAKQKMLGFLAMHLNLNKSLIRLFKLPISYLPKKGIAYFLSSITSVACNSHELKQLIKFG